MNALQMSTSPAILATERSRLWVDISDRYNPGGRESMTKAHRIRPCDYGLIVHIPPPGKAQVISSLVLLEKKLSV